MVVQKLFKELDLELPANRFHFHQKEMKLNSLMVFLKIVEIEILVPNLIKIVQIPEILIFLKILIHLLIIK